MAGPQRGGGPRCERPGQLDDGVPAHPAGAADSLHGRRQARPPLKVRDVTVQRNDDALDARVVVLQDDGLDVLIGGAFLLQQRQLVQRQAREMRRQVLDGHAVPRFTIIVQAVLPSPGTSSVSAVASHKPPCLVVSEPTAYRRPGRATPHT